MKSLAGRLVCKQNTGCFACTQRLASPLKQADSIDHLSRCLSLLSAWRFLSDRPNRCVYTETCWNLSVMEVNHSVALNANRNLTPAIADIPTDQSAPTAASLHASFVGQGKRGEGRTGVRFSMTG
ncbi:hypothetical protein BaRGS_00000890 [Batillaria attramentaria]|uniref:Uncharacterized protein n=1 Tax=Batillaria attramentaria TaxID=370345 RepID=A0ABD0M853_9CAEN